MLPLLTLATVAGAISAQLGLLLVLGFACGELLFSAPAFNLNPITGIAVFIRLYVPRLIMYLLFLMLAVQPVLLARVLVASMNNYTLRLGRASGLVFVLLAAGLQGFLVWSWILAAPMIIRIPWLWAGGYPTIIVPEFWAATLPGLPWLAGIAALFRGVASLRATQDGGTQKDALKLITKLAAADRKPAFTRHLPPWLKAGIAGLLVTLLLSGFIATVDRWFIVLIVSVGLFEARLVFLPKTSFWMQRLQRIPLGVRWAVATGAAYGVAKGWMSIPASSVGYNGEWGAFGAELISTGIGLSIALILLPDEQPAPKSPPPAHEASWSPHLWNRGLTGLSVAVLFVMSTPLAYASPCFDPGCCFTNDLVAALVIFGAILLLEGMLPLLLAELELSPALGELGELLGTAGRQKLSQLWNDIIDDAAALMRENSESSTPGDTPASTPTGQSGSPMEIPQGTNNPATIGDRYFTGHAIDEMQSDGIPPSVVEDTIKNGNEFPGNDPSTSRFYSPVNNTTVVTNGNGDVITVYKGGVNR